MDATTEFVRGLAQAVPDLAPVIERNVDYYEEILPHVVFGDITRWAQSVLARDPESPALDQFLAAIERAWADNGDGVRELLTVSFLENIDSGSALLDKLGPNLARAAHDQSDDADQPK